MNSKDRIFVSTTVNRDVETTWNTWTNPEHIKNWNNASPDWHTPKAENDLRKGGKFNSRMEAKDGSMGFDFAGIYDQVTPNKHIAYTLDDGRKVEIKFERTEGGTEIIETFEPESQNSADMQRQGWQGILDNFKKYVEST